MSSASSESTRCPFSPPLPLLTPDGEIAVLLSTPPRTPEAFILDSPAVRSVTLSPRSPRTPLSNWTLPPPVALPSTKVGQLGHTYRTPLPPTTLPRVHPVPPRPSVFTNTDYRIPRKEPALPPFIAPVPRSIQIIPFAQQRHIDRTVHRRNNRPARRNNRQVNKDKHCKPCHKVFVDNASFEAHKLTRRHHLKVNYKPDYCKDCGFKAFSKEDFDRHQNGKNHKKQVQKNRTNRT